jgi:SPP1 gp7 family putative phage head morphogenesis protein
MADYWEDRAAQVQEALTNKNVAQVEKQLVKYYANAQEKIIGQFEKTYLHLISTIEEGGKPTPADLYKLDSYWQMQAQLKGELNKLGYKQAELLNRRFVEQYQQIYKAIAIKGDLTYSTIDTEAAQQMIRQIWCADGKSWSDRIWTNTELLQEKLNENLIDCVLSGKKASDLKHLLMDAFGVSYNRADMLVRTEMAHIQTQAARQRYLDAGLQEVEVWASKDERRCEVCGKLHKKKYPIGGKMPVPAHPKCRCCILPVVD